MANVTHRALFNKFRDESLILRCESYAHWTLPKLMADMSEHRGDRKRAVVERDYQEIGALLTNNLASKLARLLFPANLPYFKIDLSNEVTAEAESMGRLPQLESMLAGLELKAAQRVFRNASYSQLILAVAHLIVTGNVAIYRDAEVGKLMTYGLQQFGVRRDGRGIVLDAVIREYTYVEALPVEVQEALRAENRSKYSRPEQEVELYTRVHRKVIDGNFVYEVTQQVDTLDVGEPSRYPDYLCPYMFPTWSLIMGENYGRGLVEDYAGGFAKLSDLSEAAALYGVEMMRVVHLVSAGGGTDIDDLANAENGEYIRGDPASVTAHESGEAQKLVSIEGKIADVFQTLARAFMYTVNTRDAERVTATEIQREAEESEYTLGGAYSALADGFQLPLATLLLVEEDGNTLQGLVQGDLRPHILTGIPALGRSSEIQNLLLAAQEAVTIGPPLAQIDKRLDLNKLIDLVMSGRSVEYAKLHLSEQEQMQRQIAQQQMQMGQSQVDQASAAMQELSMQ